MAWQYNLIPALDVCWVIHVQSKIAKVAYFGESRKNYQNQRVQGTLGHAQTIHMEVVISTNYTILF